MPSGISAIRVDLALQPLRDTGEQGVVATLGVLPFESSSIDIVVCCQVLEHVVSPLAALSEIVRVLRPGGTMLLTVPNRYALMRRRYHGLERQIDESGHIHEFREGWLRFALGQRGFVVESSEGACYDVYNILARLERWDLPDWLWSFLDRLPEDAVCRLLELDATLNRRSLRGLSLEIVARKQA